MDASDGMTPWHLVRRAEPPPDAVLVARARRGLTLVLGMAMFAALGQDPVRAFGCSSSTR